MKTGAAAFVGGFLLLATAAQAGPVADHAAAADAALAEGKALAALSEFDKAQDALWTALPLTIRKAVHVASASAVGIYSERQNAVYAPGERMLIYVEPVGYGYGDDGLGNKVIALSVDLTLKSEAGAALGSIDNIGSIKLSSRAKNRELFFSLNLSLDKASIPVGKYIADFTMRDLNSTKTAPFSVSFEIAE